MSTVGLLSASTVLADPEDAGKAGPIGLLVIIVLGIACYFLFRSMSRHLRKIREQFPSDEPSAAPPAAGGVAPDESAKPEPEPEEHHVSTSAATPADRDLS
jgi:hypothetical protein